MKTKDLLYKATGVSFILMSTWFLLASNDAPIKKPVNAKYPLTSKKEQRVYRMINAAEIKSAFALSTNKKMFLNIYPVKLSKDSQKKDFDLQVFFQDGIKDGKNLGSTVNTKKFTQFSTWYVNYLKNKNVAKEDIPQGYYIVVDKTSIKQMIGISVQVTPELSQMKYAFFYDKENEDNKKDDCGLSPMAINIPIGDSSGGKCPPCLVGKLLFRDLMDQVIIKEYK